jgi:hypothetical protein
MALNNPVPKTACNVLNKLEVSKGYSVQVPFYHFRGIPPLTRAFACTKMQAHTSRCRAHQSNEVQTSKKKPQMAFEYRGESLRKPQISET